jgi:hypothetical protein
MCDMEHACRSCKSQAESSRVFNYESVCVCLPPQRGYDVWGCYMSPVADAYGKKGLAPVAHRVEMCQLAAAGTHNVMVDAWEAGQPGYTRTLQVRAAAHVTSVLSLFYKPSRATLGTLAAPEAPSYMQWCPIVSARSKLVSEPLNRLGMNQEGGGRL